MTTHYIYRIVNLINGKVYIGQTQYPDKRWYTHRHQAANPKQVIHHAIAKYGNDAFEFEVIACCRTWEDADYCESELIQAYDSRNPEAGYNIGLGGVGHSQRIGFKHTIETLEKLRQAKIAWLATHPHPSLGKILSEEHLDKLRQPKSEETKAKISAAHTGKVLSEEHKQAISDGGKGRASGMLGKQHSEGARAKMSEAHKGNTANLGKTASAETRQKISEAKKGKPKSEETKRRMAEARRIYWEKKRLSY